MDPDPELFYVASFLSAVFPERYKLLSWIAGPGGDMGFPGLVAG